jgi:hypothetical protein
MLGLMLAAVIKSVFESQVLQVTLTPLVASWTIERMMCENKFEYTLPGLDSLGRVGKHDHSVGSDCGTSDL